MESDSARALRRTLGVRRAWGHIRAEIACSMASNYAIALYEWSGLKPLWTGASRSSLLVARANFWARPDNYERVDNLMRKVIDEAVLQVNGLSDMSVAFEQRRHPRASMREFALTW